MIIPAFLFFPYLCTCTTCATRVAKRKKIKHNIMKLKKSTLLFLLLLSTLTITAQQEKFLLGASAGYDLIYIKKPAFGLKGVLNLTPIVALVPEVILYSTDKVENAKMSFYEVNVAAEFRIQKFSSSYLTLALGMNLTRQNVEATDVFSKASANMVSFTPGLSYYLPLNRWLVLDATTRYYIGKEGRYYIGAGLLFNLNPEKKTTKRPRK